MLSILAKIMLQVKLFVFMVMATFLLAAVDAFTIADMKRLLSNKTADYNKKLRPVFNQNQTTQISIRMELVTIQNFDEVSGRFAVGTILFITWQDEFIRWNSSEYGGMDMFPAENGDFWRPPIVLVNTFESLKNIGTDWDVVRYASDGTVFLSAGTIFEVSCPTDVSYYPWDVHSCPIILSPWGFIANEVYITVPDNKIGLSVFLPNGQWDVIETSVYSVVDQTATSIAIFDIKIKRKPRFILVNIILPVVIMSFLNILVFWIPTESGERISYCLTVLLSLAVFLTLVGDTLPKTSNPMSYVSYYLLAMLVESVCIVLVTILSLRFYFSDDSTSVPECLAGIVRFLSCKCNPKSKSYRRKSSMKNIEHSHARNGQVHRENKHVSLNVSRSLPVLYLYQDNGDLRRSNNGNVQYNESKYHRIQNTKKYEEYTTRRNTKKAWLGSEDERDNITVSWKDVSTTIDVMFFGFFAIMLTTFTIIFFVVIQNAAQ